MAQASWERLAEITSGRTGFQQGFAATCKDHAHLYTQPKREVHSARADHAQAAPTEPESSRSMVPGAHARSCGQATKDPQRQTPGPLPVLRAPDELPGYPEVLSEGPA